MTDTVTTELIKRLRARTELQRAGKALQEVNTALVDCRQLINADQPPHFKSDVMSARAQDMMDHFAPPVLRDWQRPDIAYAVGQLCESVGDFMTQAAPEKAAFYYRNAREYYALFAWEESLDPHGKAKAGFERMACALRNDTPQPNPIPTPELT